MHIADIDNTMRYRKTLHFKPHPKIELRIHRLSKLTEQDKTLITKKAIAAGLKVLEEA